MTSIESAAAPILSVADLDINYTSSSKCFLAVKDLNLSVLAGEFVTIVGPSGCGKSTLLKAISGLIPHSGGTVKVKNGGMTEEVQTALVFQEPRLLPWRSALRNILFPLERLPISRDEALRRATEALTRVGLKGSRDAYPQQLSGGMQQRVNLARALAVDPIVLLLDEPFAALDAQTREQMQQELLRIWELKKKTALFVTHQVDEAIFLADRVVVLSGTPGTVRAVFPVDFERPRHLSLKRTKEFHELEDRIWSAIDRHEY